MLCQLLRDVSLTSCLHFSFFLCDWLEKTLMLGKAEGRRRRGQPRMGLLDGIIDLLYMSLSKLQEIAKDGETWHAAQGVAKRRTWLSDWATRLLEAKREPKASWNSAALLYWWGNWGPEAWSDLPKVKWQVNSGEQNPFPCWLLSVLGCPWVCPNEIKFSDSWWNWSQYSDLCLFL